MEEDAVCVILERTADGDLIKQGRLSEDVVWHLVTTLID